MLKPVCVLCGSDRLSLRTDSSYIDTLVECGDCKAVCRSGCQAKTLEDLCVSKGISSQKVDGIRELLTDVQRLLHGNGCNDLLALLAEYNVAAHSVAHRTIKVFGFRVQQHLMSKGTKCSPCVMSDLPANLIAADADSADIQYAKHELGAALTKLAVDLGLIKILRLNIGGHTPPLGTVGADGHATAQKGEANGSQRGHTKLSIPYDQPLFDHDAHLRESIPVNAFAQTSTFWQRSPQLTAVAGLANLIHGLELTAVTTSIVLLAVNRMRELEYKCYVVSLPDTVNLPIAPSTILAVEDTAAGRLSIKTAACGELHRIAVFAVQQAPEWKQRFTDLANTFVMELEHAENQTKFPPTP